jgi:hypothetical protein
MWALLLVLGLVYYLATEVREKFVLNAGGPDYYNTDPGGPGREVASLSPNTCASRSDGKTEEDAGLCYTPCDEGYYGVGPVCWAYTKNIGPGKPVGLEPCPAGWNNHGLICQEPLRWNSCKWRGLFKECWGGLEGGRLQGRLDSGGICDWPSDRGNLPDWLVDKRDSKNYKATHPNKIAGLCYASCPTDKPVRIPAMPYLCYKPSKQHSGLSYPRGAGVIPKLFSVFGYQFG